MQGLGSNLCKHIEGILVKTVEQNNVELMAYRKIAEEGGKIILRQCQLCLFPINLANKPDTTILCAGCTQVVACSTCNNIVGKDSRCSNCFEHWCKEHKYAEIKPVSCCDGLVCSNCRYVCRICAKALCEVHVTSEDTCIGCIQVKSQKL